MKSMFVYHLQLRLLDRCSLSVLYSTMFRFCESRPNSMMIHWKDVDPGIRGLTKKRIYTHAFTIIMSPWNIYTWKLYALCSNVTIILHRVAFPSKSICRDASERAREDSIRNAVRSAAKGLGHQPPRLVPFKIVFFVVVQVSQKIEVLSRYLESRCAYNAVDAQSEAIEWPTHTDTRTQTYTDTYADTHTDMFTHVHANCGIL